MPPQKPPEAFVAIREALLKMSDAERRYLRAWLDRWVEPDGRLRRSVFTYPKRVDWGEHK